jgi:hypothetical protein
MRASLEVFPGGAPPSELRARRQYLSEHRKHLESIFEALDRTIRSADFDAAAVSYIRLHCRELAEADGSLERYLVSVGLMNEGDARRPAVIGEAGGLVDGSSLTLSIHGDDLDPDEVTGRLGCAPTNAHRRGDLSRSGRPWPQGAWLLSVEGKAPTGPDELVHLLLARLPTDDALWSDLRERYTVRLWFGIFSKRWNRGFDLSADAVSRIHALGIGLEFDVYANPDDADN